MVSSSQTSPEPVPHPSSRRFKVGGPGIAAFILVALLLGGLQLGARTPLLLLERFVTGAGWLQVGLMAAYAAWIVGKLLDHSLTAVWRLRIWGLFSAVFFAQLILGLAGVEEMLMTGRLHLPVPAMILAGPIYRGSGFFMPILFLSTVLLIGPAWCSYLCYIGAWEGWSCSRVRVPERLPAWRSRVRIVILLAVAAAAFGLRLLSVGWLLSIMLASTFGLIGVGIMLTLSRRNGVMTHCVTYCPIGLIANLAGKISPFRLRIDEGCTSCMRCSAACRYEALTAGDLARRRPGLSCTLCGDCLGRCPKSIIHYHLPALSPAKARAVFLVIAVTLHTVFLAVARI